MKKYMIMILSVISIGAHAESKVYPAPSSMQPVEKNYISTRVKEKYKVDSVNMIAVDKQYIAQRVTDKYKTSSPTIVSKSADTTKAKSLSIDGRNQK